MTSFVIVEQKKEIKKRREKILVRLHAEVATASSKREIPEMLGLLLEES
jgi:hypothetical protein